MDANDQPGTRTQMTSVDPSSLTLQGWNVMLLSITRMIVVFLFGLIVPCVLLWQAHISVSSITFSHPQHSDLRSAVINMPEKVQALKETNDYILMSLLYIESVNQRTLASKQKMNIAVIHIGFSAISIGLLLLILGIDGGGIALAGGHTASGTNLRVKIASTGVLVFVTGALLAGTGGLLHRRYETAAIPSYAITQPTKQEREKPVGGVHAAASQMLDNAIKECDVIESLENKQKCQLNALQRILETRRMP